MNEYQVNKLMRIMVSLSAEQDTDELLRRILIYAMELTCCDGGTIYTKEGDLLYFRNFVTVSKDVFASSSDGRIDLPPVPLGRKHVCSCAALDQKLIDIPDIYSSKEYDFSGAKEYDRLNHYRTSSMLVVPMVDEKCRTIGVLQLINALDKDGNSIPFEAGFKDVIYGLSSLVAVCMNNQRLSKAFYELLHSFVQSMVNVIELRTPYNATHTQSMVFYGSKFIHWLNKQSKEWFFDESMVDPFLMSIWLHDIGKLITPLEVMDKSTRLGERETVIMHRLTIAILMEELHGLKYPGEAKACEAKRELLIEARETIVEANKSGLLSDDIISRLQSVFTLSCRDEHDQEIPLLFPEEIEALSIQRGTLTERERRIIEGHVVYTAQILSNVNFEGDYVQVPEWASSHHELLDGSGYPNGKKGSELSKEVRLLTILDIYDALTAEDRPYKKPLSSEKAFSIMRNMAEEGKLDKEILELFFESQAWE